MPNSKKIFPYLEISAEEIAADILQELSFSHGSMGIHEISDIKAHRIFRAYWHDPACCKEALVKIREYARQWNLDLVIAESFVEDPGWITAWHAAFKPISVGRNLWIHPPWIPPKQAGRKITICIKPGQAFGTGYHETTALCLELLESLDLRNKRMLDAGCGSGILLISAALLGAADLWACDIDPVCGEEIRGNADLNRIQSPIRFINGDPVCFREGGFHLVTANIEFPFLSREADSVCGKLSDGGVLIISGFLETQAKEILQIYSRYLTGAPSLHFKGEWAALTGIR